MNKYKELCKQHIIYVLPDCIGYDHNICDLGMTLTEGENGNGSWYCSTYEAEQDLDSFGRDTVAEFIEEYQNEFGEKPQHDAYTQPESFHCLMMIMGVEKLFNSLPTVQKLWDENLTITKKIVDQIIEELGEI